MHSFGSTQVRKILASTPNYRGTFRICVVGSTGSGKTSFLKMLLGTLFEPKAEVKRQHKEEAKTGSTYTIVDKRMVDESSTTTVSLNIADIILAVTTYNTVEYCGPNEASDLILRDDIESIWHIIWVDTAGQERFDFMPQIMVGGSDAIILFADGTNVESVVKLSYYLRLVRDEEAKTDRTIPIAVFVNKADMKRAGIFLGCEIVTSNIDVDDHLVHETSVKDEDGFTEPIRLIIDNLQPRKALDILRAKAKMKSNQ